MTVTTVLSSESKCSVKRKKRLILRTFAENLMIVNSLDKTTINNIV